MSKNKTKKLKKRNQEKWRIKGKMKKDKKEAKKNDPWSDHPETQFGPIYPFFRNHKP